MNGKTLNFAKAVIATGGTAAIPNIPGLAEAPFLTNNSIFNLTELPERFGVIGAGPVGLELAQAFQRMGSEVTVFFTQRADHAKGRSRRRCTGKKVDDKRWGQLCP